MNWQPSRCECSNRSADGDDGRWLLERRRGLHWKDGYEETNTTRKFCLIMLPKSFPFFQWVVIGYNHILMLGLCQCFLLPSLPSSDVQS
jgi:hypothetical protein